MTESIDLDAYFARIGYTGPRDPTSETLEALCRLHPQAIPFENLDTLTGKVPGLGLDELQAKLVTGRRGGYCFEQNGLFEAVLTALGFQLTPLAGRVQWGFPPDTPPRPRTHKVLKVATEAGVYLADVGFGGPALPGPLRFEPEIEQDTGHGVFRLFPVGEEMQLQVRLPEGWTAKYRISLEPQQPSDYQMANWFVATHPASPFHSNLMCASIRPDHRLGLFNTDLAIRWRDGRVEKRVLGGEGLVRLLVEEFRLPEAAVAAAAPRIVEVARRAV